jgi:hypothetical protein
LGDADTFSFQRGTNNKVDEIFLEKGRAPLWFPDQYRPEKEVARSEMEDSMDFPYEIVIHGKSRGSRCSSKNSNPPQRSLPQHWTALHGESELRASTRTALFVHDEFPENAKDAYRPLQVEKEYYNPGFVQRS